MKKVCWLFAILFCTTSCSVQLNRSEEKYTITVLEDSLVYPYIYLNELKISPDDNEVTKKLLINIQKLSENNFLKTYMPEERLKKKKALIHMCRQQEDFNCVYVSEKYTVLSNKNHMLNIKYKYNLYRSPDEFYKYAYYNLNTGERIMYDDIFSNPEIVLNKFNTTYITQIQKYLKEIQSTDNTEEVDIYETYLNSWTPYRLEDLNNIEIVYDKTQTITLRFHYNGQGGLYKIFFPPNYIGFDINELKPYLNETFKKLIGL